MIVASTHGIVHTPENGILIPYILTRSLAWNLGDPNPQIIEIYNPDDEGHWRYMLYRKFGMSFYIGFHFLPEIQSFVIYTIYGTTRKVCSKFEVAMYIEDSDNVNPQRLDFKGEIISVEKWVFEKLWPDI